MNDVTLKILQVIVSAAVIIVVRYLIPMLITTLRSHNYVFAAEIIENLVRAAEQSGLPTGVDKLKWVTGVAEEIVQRYKLKITSDQIRELIESAVQVMNTEMGKYDYGIRVDGMD